MGNLCPCCKNTDDSNSNNNHQDEALRANSQRSLNSEEINDRTPLLSKSASQHQYHQPVTTLVPNTPTTVEPSSLLSNIVPLLPPPILNTNPLESRTAKIPPSDSSMAIISERMLPDLIDVSGWGTGVHQNHSTTQNFTRQNDQLKQILTKFLGSTHISSLPDVGTSNLATLLSNRPVSSDVCHFVAHTASELSRLLIDEIKIVHKEDLLVIFE